MIAAPSLKRWYLIHRWTSLVCTAFLLLICLTRLPLVFRDQIDQWLQPHHYVPLPADTPQVSLDRLAAVAHRRYPDEGLAPTVGDDEEPQIYVWMAPSFPLVQAQPKTMHFIRFDARTGEMLER